MSTTLGLPAHINFSQSFSREIIGSLSGAGAQSMTVKQLFALAPNAEKTMHSMPLTYADVKGSKTLRQAIANWHNLINATTNSNECNDGSAIISADMVLTFCGAQEALQALYQSIIQPGDEVVVCTPSYPSLTAMVSRFGGTLKTLPLSDKQNWQMNIDQLRELVNAKTKLIVINSPHNPTGCVLTSQQHAQVLALAKKYQCYLLSDDVSQGLNFSQLPLTHDYLSYSKAIVISVMSKSFGLAGVRIGWAICQDQTLYQQLLASKVAGSICTSIVDELLAQTALENADIILTANNRVIADNITLFEDFIRKNNQLFSWQRPSAGAMALVHCKSDVAIDKWARDFTEETGILLLPSALFGLAGNYFRLGLGSPNFGRLLNEFQRFVDNYF